MRNLIKKDSSTVCLQKDRGVTRYTKYSLAANSDIFKVCIFKYCNNKYTNWFPVKMKDQCSTAV